MKKAVVLLFLYFCMSCGFLNNNGLGVFSNIDGDGNPGDGKAPRLSERRNANELENQDCDIDDDCKRACQEIFDELHSYEDCYDLSYGDVADMQNIFRALTEEDPDYQRDLLNRVDSDAFELYLEIGINGFRDEAISRIEEYSSKEHNYKEILVWLSESVNFVKILQRKDPRNEILEALFLNYAQITSLSCSSLESPCGVPPSLPSSICSCSSSSNSTNLIFMEDSTGDLIAGSRVIASVESSQLELLKALTFVDSEDWNFFTYSVEYSSRYHAFIWAYDLIEEACSNNHKDLAHQCIAGVLCWLEGIDSRMGEPIGDADIQSLMIPEVVQEIIDGCSFRNAL